jgi:hypothetical protein
MEPAEPAAHGDPAAAWRRARQRHPVLAEVVKAVALAAAILAAGTGLAWAVAIWTAVGYPSCSWPLRARGHASVHQAGLIRCYLQALAHTDRGAMMAVTDDDPPVRLTAADFTHAADARAGLATATFAPNPADSASATVTITFADGAHTRLYLLNLIAVGGPSVWRLQIGTAVGPGPSGPPPARFTHPPTSQDPPAGPGGYPPPGPGRPGRRG